MGSRRVGWIVVALSVLSCAGCVGSISRGRFDAIVRERGGGVTTDLVSGAVDALVERFGVEPAVRNLSVTPSSRVVVVEIRDPVVPDNVDRYYYRDGELDEPDPVQVGAAELLEGSTFRPSEVPALGNLESLADQALAALAFEDGYVSTIVLDGRLDPLTIHVGVSSPRATGSARFDAAGVLLEAARS